MPVILGSFKFEPVKHDPNFEVTRCLLKGSMRMGAGGIYKKHETDVLNGQPVWYREDYFNPKIAHSRMKVASYNESGTWTISTGTKTVGDKYIYASKAIDSDNAPESGNFYDCIWDDAVVIIHGIETHVLPEQQYSEDEEEE